MTLLLDCKPLPKQVSIGGKLMDYPDIVNVPYFRLQGGANAVIIDPQAGDIGIAVFASRDISGVKRTRSDAAVGSLRRMDLSDAIYIGGILNATPRQYIHFQEDGITVYSPDKITCHAPEIFVDGDNKITCHAPEILMEGASKITMDTPLVQITGRMQQTGAKGSGATTSGGLTNVGGTITSNGITLETHVHGGVQSGGSNTGEPV